ncbi:MAG TPA: hypothetical protein DIS79_02255 [Bacteroidetes bacterium]|nr:hypothetical protein [Bacteroidota bacterium]HRK03565.1 hypothetical protein [Chlorobiota bacterium]
MMTFLRLAFLTSTFVAVFTACSDDTVAPTPTPSDDVVTRSNLRPDSTIGWLYYDLDGDTIVPSPSVTSTDWDIRFAYLRTNGETRTIDILLNSGNVGPGSAQGAVVSGRFEDVTEIPTSALRSDDTAAANRVMPNCVTCANAIFVYNRNSHTIGPSPDKVVAVVTSTAGYIFQVTSIYENAPATPNLTTPLGFYHFRYRRITVDQ